ncbi:MAG: glycosyltransferase family 4 protein [Pyrinomonadaceae bacterium]
MRLLAIVPSVYDTSPGQRFRLEQWEPYLRNLGVEITYEPFEDPELSATPHKPGKVTRKMRLIARAVGRRASLLRKLRNYDAVYVFREAALFGPPIFERLGHRSGVPLIFDFDDAVFVPYVSPSNGYLSYLKFPAKTKTICRLATHVIAGNPYLADYARQTNDNVSIVPTTIDTEKYEVVPRKDNSVPVIGWSGSFSTVQHLDSLARALRRLAQKENFRLLVIGTSVYKIDGVDVEALPWRSATEVSDLRQIDIGIMPLPDEAWSRGKCGLKALQYMALGIPTVCSPVGVNSEIIQDSVNGFLAATEDEWVTKLSQLLHDAKLRARLGAAGRETVEAKYSAAVQAPRVYEILRSVVAEAGARQNESVEAQKKSFGRKDVQGI